MEHARNRGHGRHDGPHPRGQPRVRRDARRTPRRLRRAARAVVLAPAWQDKVAELVEEVGREGHLRVTTEHVRLDGSVFPAETEAITTVDRDGRPLHRMSWSEDLSERRAAEAAHREIGAMFEAAFAHAPNGVAMIGLDGRFLRVNDALCAMLGRAEAELVGHPTIEFCPRTTSGPRMARTRP